MMDPLLLHALRKLKARGDMLTVRRESDGKLWVRVDTDDGSYAFELQDNNVSDLG